MRFRVGGRVTANDTGGTAQQSKRAQQTQLMIETPYRNEALLSALLGTLKGSSWLSVSCGLTLDSAWTRTDRVAAWKAQPRHLPNDVPAVFSLIGD